MPAAAETHHSLCRSNHSTWALRHSLKHGEYNLPKLTHFAAVHEVHADSNVHWG